MTLKSYFGGAPSNGSLLNNQTFKFSTIAFKAFRGHMCVCVRTFHTYIILICFFNLRENPLKIWATQFVNFPFKWQIIKLCARKDVAYSEACSKSALGGMGKKYVSLSPFFAVFNFYLLFISFQKLHFFLVSTTFTTSFFFNKQ